jgi:hypothetical protein
MQNWCGICFFTLLLLQVLKVAFMDPEFSDVTFQFSGNYKAWCDQYHMMIWFVSLLCVFEASHCMACICFCSCEDGWGCPTWSTEGVRAGATGEARLRSFWSNGSVRMTDHNSERGTSEFRWGIAWIPRGMHTICLIFCSSFNLCTQI